VNPGSRTGFEPGEQHHHGDEEQEDDAEEVPLAAEGCFDPVGEAEQADGDDDDAGDQGDFCGSRGGAFREQADQDDGEDGDVVDAVHGLEIGEDTVLSRQQRGDEHRQRGDQQTEVLAGAHNLNFGCVLFPQAFVKAEAEQGAGAVERRVVAGEDGADQDGREESGQPGGENFAHQRSISEYRGEGLAALDHENIVGHDAGEDQI